MKENYVAPQKDLNAFNCPYCGAYANMYWRELDFKKNNGYLGDFGANLNLNLNSAMCSRCRQISIWLNDEMLVPSNSTAPMPNEDMPENVKELYNEARDIVNKSPRGAAALLRLALDKLCNEVCNECKTVGIIDLKIAILVKNGLTDKLQQAFDFVRVTGNDAVHDLGLINVQDNPEIANALFALLNLITEKMITENKDIDNLYNLIPESRRDKIEERNKKAKGAKNA